MRNNLALLFILLFPSLLAACSPPSPIAEAPTNPSASDTPVWPTATDTVRPATATPQPTPTVAFHPSHDPLIYADSEGRVLRLDLTGRKPTALSEPGVYQPGNRLQSYPFGQHPAEWTSVLSPDERFLALPDPAGSGTWLIDLTGAEPARKLLDIPAAVSWSPDSAAVAWIDSERLYVQAIPSGAPRILAAIDGLLNVAWSPRGQTIAVAASNAADPQVTLSLVDVQSGAVTQLVSARAVSPTGRGFDLAWTHDGSEVWYSPAMVAYAVNEQSVRPLLSPYVFAGERQTMYALSTTPDQQRYAWPSWDPQRADRALQVNDEMSYGSRFEITFEQAWAAYAWTEEGKNLIVQEGSGTQARLWRINPDATAPAYYLQAAEAGETLTSGYLIGTRSHLTQYHRQIAPRIEPTVRQPPAPEYANDWSRIPMMEARLSVEHPMYWNFNWPGMGDTPTTLSNFEMTSGYYLLSLSPAWFYARFNYFIPKQGSPQTFLDEAVFAPQANAEWRKVTIDGRTGYRVRWRDRPTHEEVFIPFEDNTIVHIQKYPLKSDQDAAFERMLQTAKWLPPDQWALREYPTPTPDPTRSTAPALQLVGSLPAPHWREGLSLFAVTDQGEIARATTTRLTFYDPSTLQETRTGLVTLTADLTLAALNGNGTLLARAMGNTVEILDLTGLNEQGDPPVLGALQAARQMVVRLSFSPDGKSLAVVSQPARDDIGPALLEVYDTERLRRFGSWDMVYPPDLAFSPDSHWLMSWIRAGAAPLTYYALDPAAGSASRLTIDQQVVWDSASFSADSQTLAAATNGQIAFWTVPEGQPAGSWTINPSSVVSDLAYNAGDHYLAFAQPDGIELRRTADGSLAGFADPFAYWLAFAARGNDLFLTGMDGAGAVKVWWIDK